MISPSLRWALYTTQTHIHTERAHKLIFKVYNIASDIRIEQTQSHTHNSQPKSTESEPKHRLRSRRNKLNIWSNCRTSTTEKLESSAAARACDRRRKKKTTKHEKDVRLCWRFPCRHGRITGCRWSGECENAKQCCELHEKTTICHIGRMNY